MKLPSNFKFTILILAACLTSWGALAQEADSEEYQRRKQEGKLNTAKPVEYQGVYPAFPSQLIKPTTMDGLSPVEKPVPPNQPKAASQATPETPMTALAIVRPGTTVCQVEDPTNDATFTVFPANDDGSMGPINLNFSFNFFSDSYNAVYLNNNGNISFGSAYSTFTSTGFPTNQFNMIAPFWADVDTRGAGNGLVYYKVEANRLTVIWHRVGYFAQKTDKRNTFKLILTNGNDPLIGIGNNVAFIYGDMQWTTGGSSGGTNGFGGTPATVGFNKGSGNNACYFYQQGRYNQVGAEYAGSTGNSGIDYLDNRCFFYNTSQLITLAVDFLTTKSFCAIKFTDRINNPQNYTIVSYNWNFGDGTSSTDRNPVHAYASPGTYQVSLTVTYRFGGCNANLTLTKQKAVVFNPTDNRFKDTTVTVTTALIDEVIHTSAVTFSDTWPLKHPDENLNKKHAFANGTKGVWRAAANHAYDVARSGSGQVRTAKDGTYTLEKFNWEYGGLDALPNWRRTNDITQYSPYSYELENRDILNRYSAALYDYGGQFPSANGVNMRQQEMAYTGFEYLDGNSSGNWRLTNDAVPLYQYFKVREGRDNYALVEAKSAELDNVTDVDVEGRSYWLFQSAFVQGNKILCKRASPDNPDWTQVYFERTVTSLPWAGRLVKRNVPQTVTPGNLDATVAHSGKKSLKVNSALTLKQEFVKLEPGKTYVVNAWVSVNDPNLRTPTLANNLGIEVFFKNKEGTEVARFSFAPAGRVIEGWQPLKGAFVCPSGLTVMEITFKPGSKGTAWYDDLRLHPEKGNMQSYVYDLQNFRLKATLDENNFGSFYYYDEEGRLYLTKKETEDGIKTIAETVTHVPARN